MKKREIEFRAWTGSEMVYPKGEKYALQFDGTIGEFDELGRHYDTQEGWHLLQYIGRKDSNKKKIYEGDIRRITIEEDDGDLFMYLVCCWIQEWNCFAWLNITEGEYDRYLAEGISALDEPMFFTYLTDGDEEITICGNIYESTHLLNHYPLQ